VKIFLSWSGELSRELAEALRDWLPAVLQSVKPFFTPNDIEKGARWSKDISQELESSSFGVFCLTKENLTKPWIMFEAGALSKQIDTSRVCPVLFGIESTDLEGPLVQFQASPFSENEIRKLIKTLNTGLGEQRLEDAVLTSVFDMWWPRLNEKVSKILDRHAKKSEPSTSTRSDREILEEVLQLARLNASTGMKGTRESMRFDPSAIIHSLKNILVLCENLYGSDQFNYLSTVKEIVEPLNYLAFRQPITNVSKQEIEVLTTKIYELIKVGDLV
jgi:hypothetical protein